MIETSKERVIKDFKRMSEFNATPGKGVTRFSYTREDNKAREYLISSMKELGLEIKVDPVGNIRARRKGIDNSAPAVMSGSHIDTVRHGGMFDGVAGVVGTLEAIRVLEENAIKTILPVELVIFAEEEGSNFGSTLAGSKAMTGKYRVEDLKRIKNDQGVSMYDAAKKCGYSPDNLEKHILKREEVEAMFELHVEQSRVLDSISIPVGIVEAIAGMKSLQVVIKGEANHAGATPMNLRKDPMVAAGMIISHLEKIVTTKAFPSTVGTVGRIKCLPDVANVIPGEVCFSLDIRDVKAEGVDIVIAELEQILRDICRERGLSYELNYVGTSEPVILSDRCIATIEKASSNISISYKKMNSGAVHDACLLADITDVGMIFVPSIAGKSHVPDEKTDYNDIKLGFDVLLGTILEIAGVK